jgi:hypothetical protein
MAQMGLLEEVYRLPMVPPKPETRRRIAEALAAAGIPSGIEDTKGAAAGVR